MWMIETQTMIREEAASRRLRVEPREHAVDQDLVTDEAAAGWRAIRTGLKGKRRKLISKREESFGCSCLGLTLVDVDDPRRVSTFSIHPKSRACHRTRLAIRVSP